MPAKKTKKRKASVPAWESRQKRLEAEVQQSIASGDVSHFDGGEELIKLYLDRPSSLSDKQDDEMTAFIAVTSATPIDSLQRNSVINLTDGTKFGQSIADHLKDPSKVGQAW